MNFYFILEKCLRVRLAKRPDMSLPTLLTLCRFGCIIKSTYQIDVLDTKIQDFGAKIGP